MCQQQPEEDHYNINLKSLAHERTESYTERHPTQSVNETNLQERTPSACVSSNLRRITTAAS